MASIMYTAILFVFVLGASMTYINETGLYCVGDSAKCMPDSGLQSNAENANRTSQVLLQESQHPSAFSTWNQLGIMAKSIMGGVVGLFTFGFLLQDMGIPLGLAGFLLSPLAIVFVFWLAEYWLGRPAE